MYQVVTNQDTEQPLQSTNHRSGFCNFMHLKPISKKLRGELYGRGRREERSRNEVDLKVEIDQERRRNRSRSRERRRRSRSSDRRRDRDRGGRY